MHRLRAEIFANARASTARPSPSARASVRPAPFSCKSHFSPRALRTSPSRMARPSPSCGTQTRTETGCRNSATVARSCSAKCAMRGEKWDLQLKGAGRTLFSRFGDGRAVLRSCIREYLCSEAMHGLGIPTTRALCIVGTDMPVYRESQETGAILLRMSPSHVRFGTFESFAYHGEHDAVKQLADYTIEQHYPHLLTGNDRYRQFYGEVVQRTAPDRSVAGGRLCAWRPQHR